MLDFASYNSTVLMLKDVDRHSWVSLYGGMTPNLRFNITMIVIWGILLSAQCVQVIYKQWWFSVAFICTGILEVLGYIGRTWSHQDTGLMDPFLLNMICLTIAPVFTMGGIYYQLAKLLEVYGAKFGLWRPIIYSYVFIASDIVSLAIQAAGGGTAGMAVSEGDGTEEGTHIFVAGLALQVFSMLVFIFLWFHFLYQVYIKTRMQHAQTTRFSWSLLKISQEEIDYLYAPGYRHMRLPNRATFHYFPLAMTGAVLTVFTRCVYRLAELAEGWEGNLIVHEWYFIILDAVMMSIATICVTVFHPGFAFQGRTKSVKIEKSGRKKNADTVNLDNDDDDVYNFNNANGEASTDLEAGFNDDAMHLGLQLDQPYTPDVSHSSNENDNEKADHEYAIPIVEAGGSPQQQQQQQRPESMPLDPYGNEKSEQQSGGGFKLKMWPFNK